MVRRALERAGRAVEIRPPRSANLCLPTNAPVRTFRERTIDSFNLLVVVPTVERGPWIIYMCVASAARACRS
mgnify:FL=1